MHTHNPQLLTRAYDLARKSFDEGGCPIGSVLARGSEILGEGHNQRVQQGDPIAHGEMDALRCGTKTSPNSALGE